MSRHPSIHRILLIAALLGALAAPDAAAQGRRARLLLLGSRNIRLNIQPGFSGAGSATDDRTNMLWLGASETTKMTVSTFAPGQKVALSVEAEGVTRGDATGVVQLVDGMADTDLIVNIPAGGIGFAGITYRAETSAEDGIPPGGSETHTVTFTITEQ
jgi:hypothetical protein